MDTKKTESHLNEWNYMRITAWRDPVEFKICKKHIQGIKGSAFIMSSIAECQKCDALDMLMYYTAQPGAFNGMFDSYLDCLKGYYPIKWYGMFYDCEYEARCENQPKDIYTLFGVKNDGKVLATITHFNDDDETKAKKVHLDFGREGNYDIYLLDKKHDATLVKTTSDLTFEIPLYTSILIKEI